MIELAEYQKRIVPLTRSDADALRLAAGNRLTVGLSTTDGHYELTATQHVLSLIHI